MVPRNREDDGHIGTASQVDDTVALEHTGLCQCEGDGVEDQATEASY